MRDILSFYLPNNTRIQFARIQFYKSWTARSDKGYGPVERKPVRTKAQQNEIPIERNPIRTTTRRRESPTERKAQFEPVYNKLCVGTVFAASGNVTTET